MRYDFGRCVIERERSGSKHARSLKLRHTGKFNTLPSDPEDPTEDDHDYDGPIRIPSSPRRMQAIHHKLHEKEFTDVLRPIEGYLHKSIGRLWNDIYSEVMQVLGRKGHAISHVLYQHLLRDVDTYTYLGTNGKVYSCNLRYYGDYYVHPETGRLCREPEHSRKYIRRPERNDTDRIQIPGTERWFVFIDGLWYIGTYTKRTLGFDYAPVWPDNVENYFCKIKQASGKEIRQLRALQAARNH